MNILFTCAGRRTYLLKYFKENMQSGDKVVATDMQLSAPALQAADVKIQVPAVYDPQYVDITLGICKEQKIDALISLNDLELPILADNKAKFEALGVTVIVSDPEVIDICFDKYKTAQWVESIGLNAPKTYVTLASAKEAIAKGEIAFPLFMKPRWGSGSIGLETIDDMEELDIYYHLLMKKIKKTILATASVGDEYIMIQEKLTGNEYGLDVMNDLKGNNVAVSVKQKLAMRAGETDKAITVDLPAVREMGATIGCNLKHIGNLDVDIMQRANGDYCVLELNPRFGGGYPFSYETGVNMPKAILQWLKVEKVDPAILQPEYGRMFAKNDFLMEIKSK
jgi:carbamoyl-phosphate synthase large subunit